jgi:hypothetical protein
MKHFINSIFLGTFFPVLAWSQAVSGTVTERTSGLPIRGVGVVLLDTDGRVRMGAVSDSAGSYRLTAPSAGRYRLTFSRAGIARLRAPLWNFAREAISPLTPS